MAVLNPDHLFEQAEKLVLPPAAGPPRQVDIRRAVSAAYYGVFHYVLTAVADEIVGATKKNSTRYALVYRSIDHRTLRDLCNETKKQQMAARYRRYVPVNGLGADLQAFASAFLELYEKRHMADYDPSVRWKTSDGMLAITAARSAITRFKKASPNRRAAFITLLLCPPR